MALNCRRTDCGHNDKEGQCFANVIAVAGITAQTSDGTTCDSYISGEGSQSYEFAEEFIEIDKTPSNVKNIICEAQSCRYNYNRDCTATAVAIDYENAQCETFQK